MKFILNENHKFILSESPLFNLEERFILDESTLLEAGATVAHLKTALKDLEMLLPRIIKAVESGIDIQVPDSLNVRGGNAQAEQQISKNCEDIQDLLNGRKNFKELLNKMSARTRERRPEKEYSKEELIEIEPLCNRIEEDMNSTISRFSNIARSKGDVAAQFSALNDILPRLFANIKKLYGLIDDSEDQEDSKDTKTYKYKLTRNVISLKVGDTYDLMSLIKVTPEPNKEIKATFKVINSSIATIDKKNSLTAVAEGQTMIHVTIDGHELKCACKVSAADPNKDISTSEGIDWKTKLASAVNKETVIEEFIYTVWPKEAKKVLAIKEALLPECENYGFLKSGSNRNPFIVFITDTYLNPSYGIRPLTYNIIHNLVARGTLKGEDLAGAGVMSKGNLIFCKALYKLDDGAIKMYIKKQHSILQAAKRPELFKSNAEMAFNMLYNLSQIQEGRATKDATNMQLRPMNQVEQLEAKWTETVSDTAEDEKTKTKVATNAELLKQIENTAAAAKLLVTLAIKFSSNEQITTAVSSCKEANELMNGASTPVEIQKLVASVERLYKIEKITEKQALSFIKSILESDKFEFKKE